MFLNYYTSKSRSLQNVIVYNIKVYEKIFVISTLSLKLAVMKFTDNDVYIPAKSFSYISSLCRVAPFFLYFYVEMFIYNIGVLRKIFEIIIFYITSSHPLRYILISTSCNHHIIHPGKQSNHISILRTYTRYMNEPRLH